MKMHISPEWLKFIIENNEEGEIGAGMPCDTPEQLDAMLDMIKKHSTSPWISVEDRLPDDNEYVLTAVPYKFITDTMLEMSGFTINTIFYFEDGNEWFNDQLGEVVENVTHWMPLPEPPIKKETNNESINKD